MVNFLTKANRILFFAFIIVLITVILLGAAGGFYYKYISREKDTLTYSSWKSEDGKCSIDIMEKNSHLGEQLYTGVGKINNMTFTVNVDTDRSTVYFIESGGAEPVSIGFCDFNENSFEIKILKTEISEIEDLILYRI